MKRLINNIIKFRYIIAVMICLLGISLDLNGSSIGFWNNFGLTETISGKREQATSLDSATNILEIGSYWIPREKEDGTIIGVPRGIRSDEWLVQTPFYLSQSSTGFQLVNPSYATSGQNMVVAYNAPVNHISLIGKPFNWGFLFLGASRGLSWYWCVKVIGMLLLAFEFAMILTKGKKYLSLVGSFWITFTPVVQWWFMQHLGDVVFFSLLIMVSMHHYFKVKSKWAKIGLAALLASGIIGYILVIYPAFQVPFAYLILLFTLIEFINAIRQRLINKFDILMISCTLGLSFTVVGITIIDSWDAIKTTLNTVYPGSRVSTGGELSLTVISDFLLNAILPYRTPFASNQVELSSSYHLLGFVSFLLPFVIKKKDFKSNSLGLGLVILSILLATYAIIGHVPVLLAKVTLLSFVTSSRAWQALAVISVYASIWAIAYIWDKKPQDYWKVIVAAVPFTGFMVYRILTEEFYRNYSGRFILLILLGIILFSYFAMAFRWKKWLVASILGLTLISGMTVNPVVHGLEAIEDKKLSVEVAELVQEDPSALWISDSTMLYNYLEMFGAKSLDGIRFYPDLQLMKMIDSKGSMENQWNRYSHMKYVLTDEATTMANPFPDVLSIQLNVNQLDELNVKYVLTTRDLDNEYGNKFILIYRDADNNKIYRLE
ncbi:hypothetical protein AB6M97_03745 [Streptococcus hillyeri]|uniref:Uncharacterized protein n=1 Tax=Streptococcus hillyeri TaxID=2282420 RepID=A0A3L9DUH1_9STRE|nr:hypothetical protein [Streptococcus hillyeri]RLY05136.1 hypothetical protein EAF07_00075 [Streptococcus hillyeri]